MSARIALVVLLVGGPAAAAQQASPDTLRLPALLRTALARDPRAQQTTLQARASALRTASIDAERLPALSGTGQAQYQSDVVTIPLALPGVHLPEPPHDSYDARVDAQQSLLDPTRTVRRAVERAQLGEAQAQVQTTLYSLRGEVTDAFFSAAAASERAQAIGASITDLAARLAEAREHFRAGSALPSDTATIEAALLQRRQDSLQAAADRRAALARLSDLAGIEVPSGAPIALPADLAAQADSTRADTLLALRARPEFAQFAATRTRLAEQEALVTAQRRPRVSAYGRLGYGRPGLDMLSTSFERYWLAGLQVQWAPWNWGTDRRDREELELQREIAATNEAAFARSLDRTAATDVASIDQLAATLALDDRIVTLREGVVREAAAQLRESVITSATYVDRTTDLLSARLARAEHHVALARARAHLLTTFGVEIH